MLFTGLSDLLVAFLLELDVTVASANKGWTVLHAELKQNGKVCTAGYVT